MAWLNQLLKSQKHRDDGETAASCAGSQESSSNSAPSTSKLPDTPHCSLTSGGTVEDDPLHQVSEKPSVVGSISVEYSGEIASTSSGSRNNHQVVPTIPQLSSSTAMCRKLTISSGGHG